MTLSDNGQQKWLRQLTEHSANSNISHSPFQIPFTLRATPISKLRRKGASSRDRKSNMALGEGGCIIQLRRAMSLNYRTRKGQYVSTLVAHCRSTQCSFKARLPKGVAKQVSWHTDLTDIFRSLKQIHKVKLFIDHWIFILLPLKELFLVAIL